MDNEENIAAGQIVRIGDVDYIVTPLEPSNAPPPNDDSPTTGSANGEIAQQQLQMQQEMLALMTGEGVNVNVKNLDIQARFGS